MSISERARATVTDMPERERPISEEFRLVARAWVDAEKAAAILEESKTAVLSQLMLKEGDIAANKAEMRVKGSEAWQEYLDKMVSARAEANLRRDNWKAVLIADTPAGASVVARFEYHGSHPGLHVHAHCDRGGIELGTTGLDNLARIPPAHAHHRRTSAWTESSFWAAAKRFFHVEEEVGPLFKS